MTSIRSRIHASCCSNTINTIFLYPSTLSAVSKEESGNEGLDDLVLRESLKGGYFDGVECVCIVSQFLIPMIQISLNPEDIVHQFLHRVYVVYNTAKSQFLDLLEIHSGVFGRIVHESMTDLISLLSTLVTHDGKILVKGVDEMVPEPDEEEKL